MALRRVRSKQSVIHNFLYMDVQTCTRLYVVAILVSTAELDGGLVSGFGSGLQCFKWLLLLGVVLEIELSV
jgi:hypothetical protein